MEDDEALENILRYVSMESLTETTHHASVRTRLFDGSRKNDINDSSPISIDELVKGHGCLDEINTWLSDPKRYGVNLSYIENEREKRLVIGSENEGTSHEITIENPAEGSSASKPYQIEMHYSASEGVERLVTKYSTRDYPHERIKQLTDFTVNITKILHVLPESFMGNILGFTYLGENNMAIQPDLRDDLRVEVLLHEASHCEWEYRTRAITAWKLSNALPKYRI